MVYERYLEDEVMSASKSKLVLMLYDGAIKFLKRLDNLDFGMNIETKCYNINKANAIISELQCSLNMEYDEISKPLFSLYNYMGQKLIEANIQNDPARVNEVLYMLQDLRSTWKQLDIDQAEKRSAPQENSEMSTQSNEEGRLSFSIAC